MEKEEESMPKKLFDINKLPSDGYIIFPLSMSKLDNALNAEKCHQAIAFFENKVSKIGIDGIFLYTNGLYFNNSDSAIEIRKKTNQQMLNHKNALQKLILKGKKYIPQAFHFLPWDYVIVNADGFQECFQKLHELKKKEKRFQELLIDGLGKREPTEANLNFLIEEIVVTHLIREKMIDFPKTLVKEDKFRLIVYPGSYLKADLYQWKKKVLPQKAAKIDNPYHAAQYDLDKQILYDFDKIELS